MISQMYIKNSESNYIFLFCLLSCLWGLLSPQSDNAILLQIVSFGTASLYPTSNQHIPDLNGFTRREALFNTGGHTFPIQLYQTRNSIVVYVGKRNPKVFA